MFITPYGDFDFKPLGGGKFSTQGQLIYDDSAYGRIVVVNAFVCDLASYGRVARSVFDRLGQSMRPAVLHDYLYRIQPEGVNRWGADRVYREALRLEGASWLSAYSQWCGVRAGGWVAWNRHAKNNTKAQGIRCNGN